ncbi:MAG: hypothetical protein ACJAT2_000287 [Bacteriovoracaceae bacterium]
MKRLSPLFLLLILALSSCGGSKNTGTPVDNVQIFPSLEELQAALSESSVYCADQTNGCPTNVAKLTFWSKKEEGFALAVCSGTLVNKNFIITNSHCIPDNLNEGNACDKQILVQFPRTNNIPSEDIKCKNVVRLFPMKEGQPDLAVISIENSIHQRFETQIKKDQFFEGAKAVAFTMNPHPEFGMVGTIKRKDCKISHKSLLSTGGNESSGNVILSGDDCNIISGNSGSGLFNMEGKMIGVLHQKIQVSALTEILKELGLKHAPLTYMGVAVNTSCLTSKEEATCDVHTIGTQNMDLDQFINNELKIKNLQDENPDKIRLTVNSDLSLGLNLDQDVDINDSLSTMRSKIIEIFSEAKSTMKTVLKKVLK